MTDTFNPAEDIPTLIQGKYGWGDKISKFQWNGIVYEVADWIKS